LLRRLHRFGDECLLAMTKNIEGLEASHKTKRPVLMTGLFVLTPFGRLHAAIVDDRLRDLGLVAA
jgi:hypothetical protein